MNENLYSGAFYAVVLVLFLAADRYGQHLQSKRGDPTVSLRYTINSFSILILALIFPLSPHLGVLASFAYPSSPESLQPEKWLGYAQLMNHIINKLVGAFTVFVFAVSIVFRRLAKNSMKAPSL